MKSYFFNAEPTDDLTAHPTGYDREYDADDHAAFFAPFFTAAGVMAGNNADACKVVVDSGATVKVSAGCAYVKGRMVQFDGTETVEATDGCKIVARMNKTADVRAFQLLAVTELVQTEDIYDLELATVTLTAVSGGYEAQVTDTRTFMAFTGQPPYYPPSADNLPYILWLYTLGFPMTTEQRAAVEGNSSLMNIFNSSLGASRSASVDFTAANWTAGAAEGDPYTLTIPRTSHGRQTGRFGYTLRHLVNGALKENTWAVRCTDVAYQESSGNVVLTSEDAYPGQIVFFG